jgi:hypothetical protein
MHSHDTFVGLWQETILAALASRIVARPLWIEPRAFFDTARTEQWTLLLVDDLDPPNHRTI